MSSLRLVSGHSMDRDSAISFFVWQQGESDDNFLDWRVTNNRATIPDWS